MSIVINIFLVINFVTLVLSSVLRSKPNVYLDQDLKHYVNLYIAFSSFVMLTTFFIRIIEIEIFFMLLLIVISCLVAFIIGSLLISKLSTSGKKLHSLYPGMGRTLSVFLILQYILFTLTVFTMLIIFMVGLSDIGESNQPTTIRSVDSTQTQGGGKQQQRRRSSSNTILIH